MPRSLVLCALALVSALCGTPAAAEETEGAKIFRYHCMTCHAITPGGPKRQGPHLISIIGRKAGSLDGFKYSKGLAAAGWEWTPEKIDLWLTDPKAQVPDSTMVYKQAKPDVRQKIIEYLKSLPPQ